MVSEPSQQPVVAAISASVEDLRAIDWALSEEYRVVCFSSAAEALERLPRLGAAAAVIGEEAGGMSALALIRQLQEQPGPAMALVVLHERRVSAERDELAGLGSVFFFLSRPYRPLALLQAVRRGVEAFALTRQNALLRAELERVNDRLERENRFLKRRAQAIRGLEGLLGESEAFRQMLQELERVRETDTAVHLHGETGTGKELVARALHENGPRAAGPFVAINCAGLPETLLQSALFGHRKGSFTGAERDHRGVFAEAHGGTLFLDEVAELSPPLQAALLWTLQEGLILPVGASEPQRVDVRVLSATHADLRQRITGGLFREDLYFRLVVVSLHLPPLRDRQADIPLLARHFLALYRQKIGRQVGELTPAALRALETYSWPGNVRELEHEMERLVIMADEEAPLTQELLSDSLRQASSRPEGGEARLIPEGLAFDDTLDVLMRQLVEEAMAAAEGNITAAARLLGMDRSRLGKLRGRLNGGEAA